MRRCPVCYGWISSKARICKHCKTVLKESAQDAQTIAYINNGFAAIDNECAKFEEEIDRLVAGHLKRHEFTEDELLHSHHIDKIKSIAGKMGDDISNWELRGGISSKVRDYYADRVALLRQHLAYLYEKVRLRRRTAWDYVKEFLLSTYHFIFHIAFYHFRNLVLPNTTHTRNGIFDNLGRAADNFEDFVYDRRGRRDQGEYEDKDEPKAKKARGA